MITAYYRIYISYCAIKSFNSKLDRRKFEYILMLPVMLKEESTTINRKSKLTDKPTQLRTFAFAQTHENAFSSIIKH